MRTVGYLMEDVKVVQQLLINKLKNRRDFYLVMLAFVVGLIYFSTNRLLTEWWQYTLFTLSIIITTGLVHRLRCYLTEEIDKWNSIELTKCNVFSKDTLKIISDRLTVNDYKYLTKLLQHKGIFDREMRVIVSGDSCFCKLRSVSDGMWSCHNCKDIMFNLYIFTELNIDKECMYHDICTLMHHTPDAFNSICVFARPDSSLNIDNINKIIKTFGSPQYTTEKQRISQVLVEMFFCFKHHYDNNELGLCHLILVVYLQYIARNEYTIYEDPYKWNLDELYQCLCNKSDIGKIAFEVIKDYNYRDIMLDPLFLIQGRRKNPYIDSLLISKLRNHCSMIFKSVESDIREPQDSFVSITQV